MRPKLFSVRRSVAPFAGALALITNAHATYTVIDDDLYPTAMVQARSRSGNDWSADKFKVSFTKGSSAVGPLARPSVDDLIPRMQAASLIRIVGRPDSATATENKSSIRSVWLVRPPFARTLFAQGFLRRSFRSSWTQREIPLLPTGFPKPTSSSAIGQIPALPRIKSMHRSARRKSKRFRTHIGT